MASLEVTCRDSNSLTLPAPVWVEFRAIRGIGDLRRRISSSFSCELDAPLLAGAGTFCDLRCCRGDRLGGGVLGGVLLFSSSLGFFFPKPMAPARINRGHLG